MGGVVLFWGVAFAFTAGQGALGAELPLDPTMLLAIVIVLALGAFGAALAFRSKAVAEVYEPSVRDSSTPDTDTSKVLSRLVTAWALLEGQAFVAGVLYMFTGAANLLIISGLVFIIGFAMTFPRSEWFRQGERTTRARP